jgi:hypothetical protein
MIRMRRLAHGDPATAELDELVAQEAAAWLDESEFPRDRADSNPFFVRAVLPLIGPLLRGGPHVPSRSGTESSGRGGEREINCAISFGERPRACFSRVPLPIRRADGPCDKPDGSEAR